MKKYSLSICRTSSVCITLIVMFTGLVLFLVAFANADSDKEKLTSTTPDSSNKEQQGEGDAASPTDEHIIKQLLKLQRMLEENDEAGSTYSDDERCVDTRRVRHYDVLSARFVAFEMRLSDEIYLIQFEQKCPGLRKDGTLTFDVRSGQSGRLCVSDSIQPLDSDLANQSVARGGSCRIPSFEKITEVQLLQLERGIASNRVE